MLDVESLLEAEHDDENELRLAFTLDERLAIAAALKEVHASRQGQRTDKQLPANCPEVEPGTETREPVAPKAGFSSAVRIQGRAVRRAGELLQEFDARGDHRKKGGAPLSSPSRTEAGADAGMSERRQVTAVRVATVLPQSRFGL